MRLRTRVAQLMFVAASVGCASSRPIPVPASPPADDLTIEAAAERLAADLASQISATGRGRTLVVDPLLDQVTGQQTGISAKLETELVRALTTRLDGVTILRFDADGATKARYVLAATVSVLVKTTEFGVSASLTDRPTGLVVAQSAARFVQAKADAAPTRFYDDSPSLMRDRSVDGYIRTSQTTRGSAADALYVSQIPTAGLLAQALEAYNSEKWQEALQSYELAAARSDGQQLRTFNGLYLSNIRLGRTAEATEAFGKLAVLGLSTNNLSVKLLFKPGSSVEFWPGKDLAGVYPMWIRQIARAAQTTGTCLSIVGHTSKSGTEAVNNRLSVARAETVIRLITAEVASLSRRLSANGMGYRENIIGSGTDDAGDAVDRRVEFKTAACKADS